MTKATIINPEAMTAEDITIELVRAVNTVFTTDPLGINMPGQDTLADVIKDLTVAVEQHGAEMSNALTEAATIIAKAICQAANVTVPR